MEAYKNRIEAIKKIMKRNGFKRMQDLAFFMDIKPNNLTNNIKYLAKNNNWETPFATKLIAALKITHAEFTESIDTFSMDRKSSIEIVKERSNFLSGISKTYQKEITNIIENMSEGDTYTLITTEPPWEFVDIEIRAVVLNAIKKGVKFQYIYPKVTEKTEQLFDRYENNLNWFSLREIHTRFTNKIYSLAKDDESFKQIKGFVEKGKDYFKEYISEYYTEDVLLTHPLFKFMLIETQTYGGQKRFAFVEAVVGVPNNDLNNSRNSFWYPFPENETIILFNNVENLIYNYKI